MPRPICGALAGSDLFVLADRTGKVVASAHEHPGFSRTWRSSRLSRPFDQEGSGQWWFGAQHLYQVFLKPIYFGPATENKLLGFLVIGYEIDDTVASQVSRIAASQVAFYYGDTIVRSTLDPAHEAELSRHPIVHSAPGVPEPEASTVG